MQADVVRAAELDRDACALWRRFQHADERLHHPFLSPEFSLAVGQVRDDAYVAVFHDAGEVVAFLPFQTTGHGVAEPIGAGIGDAQAIVHRQGWRFDPGRLLVAAGLRSWCFDHLLTSQPAFSAYHRRRDAAPVIDVSAGFERYLVDVAERSKSVVADTRRRQRKLGREVGAVGVVWRDDDPRVLDVLMRWKSEQYRRTGTWDRFGRSWITATVRRLAGTRDGTVQGWMSTLRVGGHPAAAHLGLRCCDVLSYWFPGYDPALDRYAPGRVLLLGMIERAAEDGVSRIDLGKGEHHYKLRFANARAWVAEGVVRADP